jgi:hypothetical protein
VTSRLTEEDGSMEPTLLPDTDHHPRTEEEVLVHDWRAEQLCGLGLPRLLADAFADCVDWREVAALVERGCPPLLAVEIVR